MGVVGCGEGVLYLTSLERPTDMLILAYSWAWLAILVAVRIEGNVLLLFFFSVSS